MVIAAGVMLAVGSAANPSAQREKTHDPFLFPPDTQPGEGCAHAGGDRLADTKWSRRNTSKGEQHGPAFRAINPNGKVPAIVDTEGPAGKEARVFDSGAILLYLGEKTGRLIGAPADRPELLSWLFFIASGLGPIFRSGRALPARCSRKAPLCRQSLPPRSGASLRSSRRASEGTRIYRRKGIHRRRYLGLGVD